MATYLSGNVRRATPNTVKAMRRSAANRQCPSCLRRSALKSERTRTEEGLVVTEWCRWTEQPRDSIYKHCDYWSERLIPLTPVESGETERAAKEKP